VRLWFIIFILKRLQSQFKNNVNCRRGILRIKGRNEALQEFLQNGLYCALVRLVLFCKLTCYIFLKVYVFLKAEIQQNDLVFGQWVQRAVFGDVQAA